MALGSWISGTCISALLLAYFVSQSIALIHYERPSMARLVAQNHTPSGCNYQGKKFQHGDSVVTSEPCLNCTCKKGVLLCFLRVCPSLLHQYVGDNCVTTRESGQCCPTVRCQSRPPTLVDLTTPEISTDPTGDFPKGGDLVEDVDQNSIGNATESSAPTTLANHADSSNSVSLDIKEDFNSAIRNRIAGKISANRVVVTQKDDTTVFQTSPTTLFYDSPKLVTSSPQSLIPSQEEADNFGSILSKINRGCYLNSTLYAEGSAVMSTSYCEYCYCIRGKKMCIRPRCHLAILGCMPRYTSEFACCPTSYVCGNSPFPSMELEERQSVVSTTAAALPLFNMLNIASMTTTPSPSSTMRSTTSTSTTTTTTTTSAPSNSENKRGQFSRKACRVGGILYQLGDSIPSEAVCQSCYCSLGGVKKCKKIHCSPIMEGCIPVIPEGHCCPVEYKCLHGHKPRLDTSPENHHIDTVAEDSVPNTTTLVASLMETTTEVSFNDQHSETEANSLLLSSATDSSEINATQYNDEIAPDRSIEIKEPSLETAKNDLIDDDMASTTLAVAFEGREEDSEKFTTAFESANSSSDQMTTPIISTASISNTTSSPMSSEHHPSLYSGDTNFRQDDPSPEKESVELILEGIIEALDRRIQNQAPSESRKPSFETRLDEIKNITSFLFPQEPLLPSSSPSYPSMIGIRDDEEDTEDEDDDPKILIDIPLLYGGSISGISLNSSNSSNSWPNQREKNVTHKNDLPKKGEELTTSKPETESNKTKNENRNTSASILIHSESDEPPFRRGSVLDGDGGVDIITAGTPLLHDIANQDSILVNLTSSSFKVSPTGHQAKNLSVDSATVLGQDKKSTQYWYAQPLDNSGSALLDSSSNEWKVISHNHSPKPFNSYYQIESAFKLDSKYRSENSKIIASMRVPPSDLEKKSRLETSAEGFTSAVHRPYLPHHEQPQYIPFGTIDVMQGPKHGLHNYPVGQSYGQPSNHGLRPDRVGPPNYQQNPMKQNSSFSIRLPNIRKPPLQVKPRPGPVMTSCRINDQEYANGAMIVKSDPCIMCRCFYGRELCHNQKCPPPPRAGCTSNFIEGYCCPRYICKISEDGSSASPVPHPVNGGLLPIGHKSGLYSEPGTLPSYHSLPSLNESTFTRDTNKPMASEITVAGLRPYPNRPDSVNYPPVHPPKTVQNSSFGPNKTTVFKEPENVHDDPSVSPYFSNKNMSRVHFPVTDKKKPLSTEMKNNSVQNFHKISSTQSPKPNLLPHLILQAIPNAANQPTLSRPTWPESRPHVNNQTSGILSSASDRQPTRGPTSTTPMWSEQVDNNGKPFDILRIKDKQTEKPLSENGSASEVHRVTEKVSWTEKPQASELPKSSPSIASVPFSSTTQQALLQSLSTTESPEIESSNNSPWDKLRVSGCNIYGTFYKVGQTIKELSSSCKKCTCSDFGVQCKHVC